MLANLDEIHLEKAQRDFLAGLAGINLRQDVRDLYLSQSFRKDIWVKGAINLTVKEKAEALSQIFICENNPPNICDYEIKGNLGSFFG